MTDSSPIAPPDGTRLTIAHRILDDAHSDAVTAARWMALVPALAAWPGAPMIVQRTLVTPAPDALVAETIVATISGAGVLAPADELARDVAQLLRPLLADVRCATFGGAAALRAAGPASGARDTAWFVADPAPIDPASGQAAEALAAALGVLADSGATATIDFSLATPPALRDAHPAVCFHLQVAADVAIPNAALAHLAALMGAGADAWERRRPALTGRSHWRLVAPEVAARATLAPVRSAALRVAGAPLAARDVTLGHTAAGAPFGLDGAARRSGVVLLGDPAERAVVLCRAVTGDLRRGRRLLWLDLDASGSSTAGRPLPAATAVVDDLLSSPGRAIFLPVSRSALARERAADLLLEILATPWLPGQAPSVFVDGAELLPGERLGDVLDRPADCLVKLTVGARADDPVLACLRRRAPGCLLVLHGGEPALPATVPAGAVAPGRAIVRLADAPGSEHLHLRPRSGAVQLRKGTRSSRLSPASRQPREASLCRGIVKVQMKDPTRTHPVDAGVHDPRLHRAGPAAGLPR